MNKITDAKQRAATLRKINATFNRLAYACESRKEWNRFIAMVESEERLNRKSVLGPNALSLGDTVKLFAVKAIFERIALPRICRRGHQTAGKMCPHCGLETREQHKFTPHARDFFHIKRSIFAACAIAVTCRAEIRDQFNRAQIIDWLSTVEFAALN